MDQGIDKMAAEQEAIVRAMWAQRSRDNADVARHFERMDQVKTRIIREVGGKMWTL